MIVCSSVITKNMCVLGTVIGHPESKRSCEKFTRGISPFESCFYQLHTVHKMDPPLPSGGVSITYSVVLGDPGRESRVWSAAAPHPRRLWTGREKQINFVLVFSFSSHIQEREIRKCIPPGRFEIHPKNTAVCVRTQQSKSKWSFTKGRRRRIKVTKEFYFTGSALAVNWRIILCFEEFPFHPAVLLLSVQVVQS